MRGAANRALGQIDQQWQQSDDAKEAISYLRGQLEHSNEYVRNAANEALDLIIGAKRNSPD